MADILIYASKNGQHFPIKWIGDNDDEALGNLAIKLNSLRHQGFDLQCAQINLRNELIIRKIQKTPLDVRINLKNYLEKNGTTPTFAIKKFIETSLQNKFTFDIKTVRAEPVLIKSWRAKISYFISAINPIGWIAAAIISKLVLKAQTMKFDDALSKKRLRNQTPDKRKQDFIKKNSHHLDIKLAKVMTPNTELELDTIEISKKNCRAPKDRRMHVIHFVGYNMCYEEILKDMKREALDKIKMHDGSTKQKNKLDPVVIGFNYPRVVNSKGRALTKDDLVKAGIALVQSLLDEGVPLENIILHGYSLGGAIASLIAKYFQEQKNTHDKIYLFNNRSLGLLTDVVISWTSKWLQPIVKPFLKFSFSPINGNWEMDAASAFLSLNKEQKSHLIAEQDHTIPYHVSMHKKIIDHLENSANVNLDGYLADESKQMRMSDSAHKKHEKNKSEDLPNPHSISMRHIEGHDGINTITGEKYFRRFVKQAAMQNGLFKEPKKKIKERDEYSLSRESSVISSSRASF